MRLPELRKIPAKETDIFRNCYEVMLLNPFYNDQDRDAAVDSFREEFVTKPTEQMKLPDGEKDVLSFYKHSPHRLITDKPTDGRFMIREEDKYFLFNNTYLVANREKSLAVNVVDCERMNPEQHYPEVIKNLASIVEESSLSSGDRILLRDIAIESFHERLRLASGENYDWLKTFHDCLNVRHQPNVIYRLHALGFKFKDKIVDEIEGRDRELNLIDLRY